MPKKLILVRHAKSDWSVPGQRDFDRELNERGHRDAPRMGKKIADMGIKPDVFVSSPAARAKMTAEYFAEQFKVDTANIVYNENIYEASARILMNEVNALDDHWTTVLLFAHNPGFSFFAEYLTKAEIGDMPTCAVVAIDLEVTSWKEVSGGLGGLVFYEYPTKD